MPMNFIFGNVCLYLHQKKRKTKMFLFVTLRSRRWYFLFLIRLQITCILSATEIYAKQKENRFFDISFFLFNEASYRSFFVDQEWVVSKWILLVNMMNLHSSFYVKIYQNDALAVQMICGIWFFLFIIEWRIWFK